MNLASFMSHYTARWEKFPGNLKDPVHMRLWERVIERIPEDRADEVFGIVEAQSPFRPKPGRFFVALKGIAPAAWKDWSLPPCGMCGDTSWVYVIGSPDPANPRKIRVGHNYLDNFLFIFSSPCGCTLGKKRIETEEIDPAGAERCFIWHQNWLSECRLTETSNPYAKAWRLAMTSYMAWHQPGAWACKGESNGERRTEEHDGRVQDTNPASPEGEAEVRAVPEGESVYLHSDEDFSVRGGSPVVCQVESAEPVDEGGPVQGAPSVPGERPEGEGPDW